MSALRGTVPQGVAAWTSSPLAAPLAQEARRLIARLDMIDCKKPELLAAHTLLVIVSTQGEGDPPDRAAGLWELLNSRRAAPQLSHVRYAVLGLGDSSCQNFCETGRQFDARLDALRPTLQHYRTGRSSGESFGDFVIRAGIVRLVRHGRESQR